VSQHNACAAREAVFVCGGEEVFVQARLGSTGHMRGEINPEGQ